MKIRTCHCGIAEHCSKVGTEACESCTDYKNFETGTVPSTTDYVNAYVKNCEVCGKEFYIPVTQTLRFLCYGCADKLRAIIEKED